MTKLLRFLKDITTDSRLAQFAYEYALPDQPRGRRSSPSLYMAIIHAFGAELPEIKEKTTTAWRALKLLLKLRLTKEHLGPREVTVRRMMNLLVPLKKLLCVMFHEKPLSERQAMSDVRNHVIRENFSVKLVNQIKKDGRFSLAASRKEECKEQQLAAVKHKTLNQRTVDYEAAIQVGLDLVQECRAAVTRERDTTIIPLLLATVMYATGSRITEAVILSDYYFSASDDSNDLITIDPVAKGRSGKPSKFSRRRLLFNLRREECLEFVGRLRELLALRHGDRYSKLDSERQADRDAAMRLVHDPLTKFVKSRFSSLLSIIPRDLRALYVSLSYRSFAPRPTSECMWINQVLGHTSLDTSIAYNSFSLTGGGHYNKTKLAEQARRIEELEEEIQNLTTQLHKYQQQHASNPISSSEEKEASGVDPRPQEGSCVDEGPLDEPRGGVSGSEEESKGERSEAESVGADGECCQKAPPRQVSKRPRVSEDEAHPTEEAEAATATGRPAAPPRRAKRIRRTRCLCWLC